MFTPEFRWAERKDEVFLTLDVPNVAKEPVIKLTNEGTVYFKGTGGPEADSHEYVLDIQLAGRIKAEESQCNVGARAVRFKITKESTGPYWGRLLEQGKNVHCKIDWDHWLDEDEEAGGDEFGAHWDSKDMANLDFADGQSAESDAQDDEDDAEPAAEEPTSS